MEKCKLHLGCGWRDFGSDWIHIDNGDYEHLNHKTDITNLSMFQDNSVDLLYASHVIAYFDMKEILGVLGEWNRVLKPNGILRLATPDFSSMVDLYHTSSEIPLESILGPLYGKMGMDGENIYHKTTYDYSSLENVLRESNFKDIDRYDWRNIEHAKFDDHSQAHIPHMDKENGKLISLNVECKKV